MQLPPPETSFRKKVRAGRYTIRKLIRFKRQELANELKDINAALKADGRNWEDKEDDTIDAYADRDAVDDTLDASTQDIRVELAGRGRKASTEAPYTDVFHSGVGHYTEATLDLEVERYMELVQNISTALPEDDPIRVQKLPVIEAAIDDYKRADEAVTKAEIEVTMARLALKKTEASWARVMEKIYGLLIAEIGLKAADRFFR